MVVAGMMEKRRANNGNGREIQIWSGNYMTLTTVSLIIYDNGAMATWKRLYSKKTLGEQCAKHHNL